VNFYEFEMVSHEFYICVSVSAYVTVCAHYITNVNSENCK